MKVYKFTTDSHFYAYAAKSKTIAIKAFRNEVGTSYNQCVEIPQSQWDKRDIKMHEDNDTSKKAFKLSIRELMTLDDEPILIYTNDMCLID